MLPIWIYVRPCEGGPPAPDIANASAVRTLTPPLLASPAGMFSPSLGTRLAHLCDAVVMLEGVSDTSGLVRLVPDSARWAK